MMVVNVFLAMSLGQSRRRHIRVEIVLNALPRSMRRAAEAFSLLCSIALFALIAWFGWKSGLHATGGRRVRARPHQVSGVARPPGPRGGGRRS